MPYPRRTLASLGLLFVLGCSSSDDGVAGRPKTYPVDGLVLYNGNPVEGATVVFNSPTENRGAAGLTDAQGRFTLKTFKPGDGAVAGKHEVQISKIEIDKGPKRDPEATPPPPKEIHRLPKKYSEFKTSGLTAEVNPNGKNHFEFKLTD